MASAPFQEPLPNRGSSCRWYALRGWGQWSPAPQPNRWVGRGWTCNTHTSGPEPHEAPRGWTQLLQVHGHGSAATLHGCPSCHLLAGTPLPEYNLSGVHWPEEPRLAPQWGTSSQGWSSPLLHRGTPNLLHPTKGGPDAIMQLSQAHTQTPALMLNGEPYTFLSSSGFLHLGKLLRVKRTKGHQWKTGRCLSRELRDTTAPTQPHRFLYNSLHSHI